MAKYIDADKLIAGIERRRQVIRVLNEHTAPEQTSKTCAIFQYSDTILSELLSFIDSLQQEQPAETDKVKWRIDGDYDETDKGRFVLGSVGIGYNGYYIPYSDLLKLPKENEK